MHSFFDESFWLAASITIFFALSVKYARKPLIAFFDSRINIISNKINQATALAEEAEEIFKEQLALNQNLSQVLSDMDAESKAEIKYLEHMAALSLDAKLKIQSENLLKSINNQQEVTLRSLRLQVLSNAIAVSEQVFLKNSTQVNKIMLEKSLVSLH